MTFPSRSWRSMFALLVGGWSASAHAAQTGTVVELPPMMVEESASTVPWLYVSAGGTEFLSRCSESTTYDLVTAWLAKLQLIRALVPEEFLARMDTPSVFVLYAQDLKQTVSAEILRDLQAADGNSGRDLKRENDVNIAPSMRLTDRDTNASIAYIDEARFDSSTLSVAPGHVRYLLETRVPKPPVWLVEGVERAWRHADFVTDPITLHPLVWLDRTESDELTYDRARPRALLPAGELFASDAMRLVENKHPRRLQIRAAQQELFFRWATVTSEATRTAFWKFATRAAEAPVTEEMFESCFGFDFAELRDRLSDYLPVALEDEPWIDPGKLPPPPRIDVARATPNQIARVRGEWERLAITYVQRRLPQVREPYLAQARRTLHRGYDTGDRDPRLLATMGLCEVDAGNETAAREFLEPAVEGGVVRPRAYYELARIRFADLQRAAPGKKLFTAAELAPVLKPLQQAITQAPPLPEIYALLGETWAHCESPLRPQELAELETGARLFARQPPAAFPIALAFAIHGKKPAAAALLDGCVNYAMDDATRDGIARLRAELASPANASVARP